MSQQQAPADFGHADSGNAVYVRVDDIERGVRQISDFTSEETLVFYTRRCKSLTAEATLPVSRVETQTMSPEEARKAISAVRTNVTEANVAGDLTALTARLDALEGLLPAQIEAHEAARAEQNVNAIVTKHATVNEAEALAGRNDWRRGVDRFRELLGKWKALLRVDRITDNELWYRLSPARAQCTCRRKVHPSELNARRDEAKRLKRQIVAEATPLTKSTDWDPTADTFRDLMARWRAAGSARRADDESSWAKFHALQDRFFKARSAAQHAMDGEQAENPATKATLLEQAERDPADVINIDTTRTTLRGFFSKLPEIEHVPRAAMRDLDSRARKLFDRIDGLEAEHWRHADPEARKRAEDTVALFQSRVDKLTKDLDVAEVAGDTRKTKDVRRPLEIYASWLDQTRQTLQDLQDI